MYDFDHLRTWLGQFNTPVTHGPTIWYWKLDDRTAATMYKDFTATKCKKIPSSRLTVLKNDPHMILLTIPSEQTKTHVIHITIPRDAWNGSPPRRFHVTANFAAAKMINTQSGLIGFLTTKHCRSPNYQYLFDSCRTDGILEEWDNKVNIVLHKPDRISARFCMDTLISTHLSEFQHLMAAFLRIEAD